MKKQTEQDDLLANAHATVRDTAKRVGFTQEQIDYLLKPKAKHHFLIELETDSGVALLPAFRVQHNDSRGPHKGGIRFHPEVNQSEVEGLALLMSLKTAAVGIPLGGGKGGIAVDPRHLTDEQLEQISRAYVRNLHEHIGPDKDVPAPDVNTNATIMDWMVDEYEQLSGDTSKATFTGKSLDNGGSAGREAATGRGGLYALQEALQILGRDKQLTVAVQGFGNVGYWFAKLAAEVSYLDLIAVSDSRATIKGKSQLNIDAVMEAKSEGGSVSSYERDDIESLGADDILEMNVDVLVLGALDNAITDENVDKIKAKYIVELANGPISSSAYKKLHERGVIILPDVIANAGGVIVSYLEWMQNRRNERWPEKRVNNELSKYMSDAVAEMIKTAQASDTSFKDAAFELAIKRLLEEK